LLIFSDIIKISSDHFQDFIVFIDFFDKIIELIFNGLAVFDRRSLWLGLVALFIELLFSLSIGVQVQDIGPFGDLHFAV
jgi:hypothetical protein